MGYPNLEAEIARSGVTRIQIANLLKRDKSTVSTWIKGSRGGFSVHDAQVIRNTFFPGMSLDYLFSDVPLEEAR